MGEEASVRPAQPLEPIPCTLGLVAHPLELAASPPDDIGIDPLQGWTQLRLVEMAVVVDPAATARIVHLGQVLQGLVTAMMKRPAPNGPTDGRQRLRAGRGLEAVRKGPLFPLSRHRLAGSKLTAEKVERDAGKVSAPVGILAIDDLRLLGMQHQLARCEPLRQRVPQCPRLHSTAAVTNGIVRVPLERNVRVV